MTMMPDPDLDPISARLRQEEQRLRRRVLVLTLIPVAVAVALIWITSRQVSQAKTTLAALADSTADLEAEIANRLATLDAARRALDSLNAQARLYERWIDRRSATAADSLSRVAAQQFEAERVRPRVYLHIIEESQRVRARALQTVLENARFDVREIDLVRTGPAVSEIRYFRTDDRETADRLRQLAGTAGQTLRVRDLTARYGSTTSDGHFEIWLARD
jgi:hypothetical protein